MGGGQSSNASTLQESLTNIVANVINQQIQNNSTVVNGTQTVNQSGNNNVISNTDLVQSITINVQAITTAQNITNMQNQISTQLQAAITAQVQDSGFLDFNDSSYVNAQSIISTSIASTITNTNIQNCLTSLSQSQTINQSGSNNVIYNTTMQATVSAAVNCVMNTFNSTQINNALSAIDNLTATASTSTGYGEYIIIIVIGLVVLGCIAGVVAYVKYSSNKSSQMGPMGKFKPPGMQILGGKKEKSCDKFDINNFIV